MVKIENIALKSAAGSGKTRELTKQFLLLFLSDVDYPLNTIYGITFTNEAALEMKNRLLRFLDLLAGDRHQNESEEGLVKEFRKIFPDIVARAKRKKRYLLNNLSDLNVSTFHSLFASFLSSIPFAAGVLPSYEIVDETEEQIIFDEIMERIFETIYEDNETFEAVNELVEHEEKGLRDVIVDTYYKTVPWVGYLSHLIDRENEVRPQVPAKQKAFVDSLGKFIEFANKNISAARTKTTGTTNKDFARFLSKIENFIKMRDLELLPDTVLTGDYESKKYMANFIQNLAQTKERFLKLAQEIQQSRSEYFNLLSDEQIIIHLKPILNIYRQFQREKQNRNVLSFDDIEVYTLSALKNNPEPDYLYFKIGGDVNHLLIDEFQDTSFLQLEILTPILSEITSLRPKEKSLFYVGDPHQAIFRWRGGAAELFDLLADKYRGKIKKQNLSINYRSREEIVKFVNKIVGTDDQAKPGNGGGWIRVENIGDMPDMSTAQETIAARVRAIIEELNVKHGYDPADIAVLVRRNEFGTKIAEELARHNIDCLSRSRADILSRDDVLFILNLLRFLDNPDDDFTLMHVLTSPVFNIQEETLRQLKSAGKTLFMALNSYHPDWSATKKLNNLLKLVYFCNPYELLYRIYKELAIKVSYGLSTLLDVASDYTKKGFNHLSAFIDWLEKIGPAVEIKEKHPEGVEVLTVHKAKGLEFEVVLLAETFYDPRKCENEKLIFSYTQDGINPDKIYWRAYGKHNKELVEAEQERINRDELNLLYVAMTRARSGLYIIGCCKKEAVGLWYEIISSKVGRDYEIGTIRHERWAREQRARKTYGVIAAKPTVIKEERTLYSPTEREVEIMEPERRRGMEFGDIVHKALSRLESIDEEEVGAVVDRLVDFVKNQFVRRASEIDVLEAKLRPLLLATLTDEDLRPIFYRDGRKVEFRNELALYFAEEKRDVSIHLDRVVIEPEKILIIDYKTGDEKPEYRHQLMVYKKGIEIVFPNIKIEAALVYLECAKGKKMIRV